jgi:chromosomal replication initiator protein
MPNYSLKTIGSALGGRDHSTVIHSIQQAADLMQYDKQFKKDYTRLNEFIKTNL